MKIVRKDGTWVFTETSIDDEEAIKRIAILLKKNSYISFYHYDEDSEDCLVAYISGERFCFYGKTEDDNKEIRKINEFSKASQSFYFLGGSKVDGHDSMTITCGFCKKCKKPIIDSVSLEFCICRSCTKDCQHFFVDNYQEGGRHCKKCGLPKTGRKRGKKHRR